MLRGRRDKSTTIKSAAMPRFFKEQCANSKYCPTYSACIILIQIKSLVIKIMMLYNNCALADYQCGLQRFF